MERDFYCIFCAIKVPAFDFKGLFPGILKDVLSESSQKSGTKRFRENIKKEWSIMTEKNMWNLSPEEALQGPCQTSEQGLTTEQAEKIRLEAGEICSKRAKRKARFRSFRSV